MAAHQLRCHIGQERTVPFGVYLRQYQRCPHLGLRVCAGGAVLTGLMPWLPPGHFRLYAIRSMSMLPSTSPHLLDKVKCGSDKALEEREDLKDFENSLQKLMKFIHRQRLQNTRRHPHPDIAGTSILRLTGTMDCHKVEFS